MSKKKKLIPFGMTLAGMTLKGKPRDIAEAHYYLSGEELDRKLIELEHSKSSKIYKEKTLELDKKYEKIEEYDYEIAKLKLKYEDEKNVDYLKKKLELDKKHEKITDLDYDRESATLKGEPFIRVIDTDFKKEEGLNGIYFEFDWNQLFIDFLKSNGYNGVDDQSIIERWVKDLYVGNLDPEDMKEFYNLDPNNFEPLPMASKKVNVDKDGNRKSYE